MQQFTKKIQEKFVQMSKSGKLFRSVLTGNTSDFGSEESRFEP